MTLELVVNMEQRTEKYNFTSAYDIKPKVDKLLAEEEQFMTLKVNIGEICLYESEHIDPTEGDFDTDDMETEIWNELEAYISELKDLLK